MRIRLAVLGIVLVCAAAGGCTGAKPCTLIGCGDSFSASVRRADGSFPAGLHRVEVFADGASLTCTFMFPLETAGGGVHQPSCPAPMGVSVWPLTTCQEMTSGGAVSQQCDPIPGKFLETIDLAGTPRQVHAWQYVDDAAILDAAAAPVYEDVTPNGPECGPVCRQASVAWTLQ
jgi:hypothetical protein